MPCSMALRPASSAATCAAYGVDLREPLKPWLPADDHAIVFPWASVIVIIVLLKVAFTCAVPEVMFFRSRRRRRGAAAAVLAMDRYPPKSRAVRSTSSCRRSDAPDPCGFARWYACADRAPAAPCGDASRD